jgi:hypothetical protein
MSEEIRTEQSIDMVKKNQHLSGTLIRKGCYVNEKRLANSLFLNRHFHIWIRNHIVAPRLV